MAFIIGYIMGIPLLRELISLIDFFYTPAKDYEIIAP
jgi:hypothetical protein